LVLLGNVVHLVPLVQQARLVFVAKQVKKGQQAQLEPRVPVAMQVRRVQLVMRGLSDHGDLQGCLVKMAKMV